MKRLALVLSVLIGVAGVTLAGISNADTLISGIHERFPWMRGSCDIWSGWAFIAVFGLAIAGFVLAIVGRPAANGAEALVARGSIVLSLLVVGYWLLAAFSNFSSNCIA